jgi:peroxiredoxin
MWYPRVTIAFSALAAVLLAPWAAVGQEPSADVEQALKRTEARKALIAQIEAALQGKKEVVPKLLAAFDAFLALEPLDREQLAAGNACAQVLQHLGDLKAAEAIYDRVAKRFAKAEDQQLAELAGQVVQFGREQLAAAQKKLEIVGQPLELSGTVVADGSKFDWTKYRGKVVLVDFWATWCGPCVAELPNVRAAYDKYHEQGFDVVAISLDDDVAELKRFLAERKIPWTTLRDEGHPLAEKYGITAIPSTFLVGRDGKVLHVDLRGERLLEQLAEVMKNQPAEKLP